MKLFRGKFHWINGISWSRESSRYVRRMLLGCDNIQDIMWKAWRHKSVWPLVPPAANSFTTTLFPVRDCMKTSVTFVKRIFITSPTWRPSMGCIAIIYFIQYIYVIKCLSIVNWYDMKKVTIVIYNVSYITIVIENWNWEYFHSTPVAPGWDRTRT